jgi:serine/threonine protein kinase
MVCQLRIVGGLDKGKIILLEEGVPLLFGRSRHADIKLNDLHVSRVHCEVELEDGQVQLNDHESSGTFVNGKRVGEATLKPNDVVQIGETQMRLHVEGAAARPAGPPAKPKTATLSPDRLNELSGRPLSHYHVGPLLAQGQSGLVFRAKDFKDDSDVALKVLWPMASGSNQEVRRLVRSVKTMLPLKHPNLVGLRGAGKTGPYCWIAMELVQGESLSQVIQRIGVAGMLDWRHAFRVALHVGQGLEFAHGHQIIHRNITPNNVLISAADKTVKLGDLMLAKALEGQLAEQITRPGEMLGDIRYMAPERTMGTEGVDGRSDIYSLGALVYALLTGRPPFEGNSLVEKIMKIRTAPVEPPKKYQMSIPDLFQGVVLKMLAKRPEDRHQTAAELVTDLKRVGKFAGQGR